nr:RNA-dependent RNA polymerase [Mercurialis latent virus]
MDVKSTLVTYFLMRSADLSSSFGIATDNYLQWFQLFLFKDVIEHTAKYDFATIHMSLELALGRFVPIDRQIEEDNEECPKPIMFSFDDYSNSGYDDLDFDYTSEEFLATLSQAVVSDDYPKSLPSTPSSENEFLNKTYISEGTAWADVSDYSEEIQSIPDMNVSISSDDLSCFNLEDDDGDIREVSHCRVSDSLVPEISSDADLRMCDFISYEQSRDSGYKWKPKINQVAPDPSIIQSAVDELFPHHHEVDDRFFQEWVETDDISLEVTKCDLDLSNFNDWTKGANTRLVPNLSVGGLSHRVPTQREALLAIKKRNMNVPELQSNFDVDTVSQSCFKRFVTHVIDKSRLSKLVPVSGEELHFFNQYIENKRPNTSEYKGPIPLVALDKYLHMIKTTLKPVEEDSLAVERPIPATITYHKKGVVMLTSPYFLCAMVRLLYCLKRKFSIPTGKYHQLFHMDPTLLRESKFFKEIDFSKFDKSQGQLHHIIQSKVFSMLGLPQHFVDTWSGSHEMSHIYDRDCGVGFSVDYQRRTGDACTYLGNTIVTLCVLSYVYDLSSPKVLFVTASGDDSLIGSTEELPRGKEELCVSLFNFETKFPHNQPFICSKFLLDVECEDGSLEVLAVPNPLKLLQKLGPKNLQVKVLDDYYQSLCDLLWVFKDAEICRRVADLASFRRFKGAKECLFLEAALLSLPSLVANRLKFIRRTINLDGSKICIRKNEFDSLADCFIPRNKRESGLDDRFYCSQRRCFTDASGTSTSRVNRSEFRTDCKENSPIVSKRKGRDKIKSERRSKDFGSSGTGTFNFDQSDTSRNGRSRKGKSKVC